MTSHVLTTADAAPRWTPSATLAETRRLKPTAGKVLFYLRHVATNAVTAAEINRSLGCSNKTAYTALHALKIAGLAREIGDRPARYEPT